MKRAVCPGTESSESGWIRYPSGREAISPVPRGSGERPGYSVISMACKHGLSKLIRTIPAFFPDGAELGHENGLTTTRITIRTINSAGISLKIRKNRSL